MPSEAYIALYQARSFGDVLNATFAFIRQNLKPLGRALLFLAAPWWMLVGIVSAVVQINLFSITPDQVGDIDLAGLGLQYLLLLLLGLLSFVVEVVIVYSFLMLYQERGHPGGFGLDDVWRRARGAFGRVTGATLLVGCLYVAGLPVMLIPCLGLFAFMAGAVYFAVALAPVFPMLMREEVGVIDALSRSRRLVRHHWWPTAGVLFFGWLTSTVLGLLFSLPSLVLTFAYEFNTIEGGMPAAFKVLLTGASLVGSVGSALLYTIPLLAVAFQYYSLVEIQERVGLRARIQAVATRGDVSVQQDAEA